MSSNPNHDLVVQRAKKIFEEYGFFTEDREGEMLQYLRQKYGYGFNTRPDLVCSTIKSLDTYTDFAIEVKTFESIKQNLKGDDKKQLQELSSALPTFL